MPEVGREDPVMARVRDLFKTSGWTLQELGERMQYEGDTARKAAHQFLNVKVPRLDTLRKFATAVGVSLAELVTDKSTKRPKK